MPLPQFIGIGTRRCGSSWLHHVLNGHPGIGKPQNGLHFFSQHYEQGADWYSQQFATFGDRETLVELSVSYLYPEYHEAVVERMARTLGRPNLFVCLRDPVERTFSDYLRSIRMQELPADMSFEEAMEQHPVFLDRSRYGQLLRPFYDRFGAGQIKTFFFQDLEADKRAFADDLVKYLGLSEPIPAQALQREEPKGKSLRSPLMSTLVRRVKAMADGTASALGAADVWSNWKGRHMESYERLLELNHQAAALNSATAARLRQELAADIKELEAMTGRDLRSWRDAR